MTIIEYLLKAIEDKNELTIIYHEGAKPGSTRKIISRSIEGDTLKAVDTADNRVKSYSISKIEILNDIDEIIAFETHNNDKRNEPTKTNNIFKLNHLLSTETFIIFFITIFSYFMVYSYEFGYAIYYNINIHFINISLFMFFHILLFNILFPFFCVIIISYIFFKLSKLVKLKKSIQYEKYILDIIFLLFIILLSISKISKSAKLEIFLLTFTNILTVLIFPIVYFTYVKDKANIEKLKTYICICIMYVFFFVWIGYSNAKLLTTFDSFTFNNKLYAVIRIYNNTIIASEIIDNNLDKNLLYITDNLEKPLRLEKITLDITSR
ncbi:hypothetical protein RHO14_06875 [Orbus wheelerorum]|uniref:hypothetical protein n=1 Tax=Orbus wheelerorum TaxID=3074111 RepID=UPI00370D1543